MHINFLSWALLTLIQLVIVAILEVFRKQGLLPRKRPIPRALVGLQLLVMVPLLPAIDRIRASPPSDYFEAGWFAISLVCAFAGALVLVGALSLKSKERGDCG